MSDSHGLQKEVRQVVERHPAEIVLHCGDFCVDHKLEPFKRMALVRGNCDAPSEVALERVTNWQSLRIFQTHGHLFGVKNSLLRLHYRAEETGANVVIFGHSHVPVCTEERGILFINPGSLQSPRQFPQPTYVVLNQAGATDEGVQVEVVFYEAKGTRIKELGGTYRINR